MKALVIGGTGPTGPLIVSGLQERGYEPVILHRGTHEIPELEGLEHIHADPHFAETLSEGIGDRRFDLVLATYGRIRLLGEVLAGKSERLITVGGTAYADLNGLRAHEGSPRAVSNKIVQKIVETEEALLAAHEAGVFNLTHLRYPNLWGARQLAPREWAIIRRVRDGRPFIPVANGGLTLESKAYVENAAHAVLLAVDKPSESAGQMYNVADDETRPDYVRVMDIVRAMGSDAGLLNLPEEATGPASFWGIGRDLNFSREGRPPRTIHKLLDNGKIARELGYRDLVPYEEAVRRTVEWYQQHPIAPGSEDEKQLSDPFDYAAEDAYARLLAEFVEATKAVGFGGVEYVHQYSHPKEPTRVK